MVAFMGMYLHYSEADVLAMTPEGSGSLRKAAQKHLDREEKMRLIHTQAIMRAAGARVR